MLSECHEKLDKAYNEARSDQAKYDVEKTRAMVTAYYIQYENDGYKTVAVEKPIEEVLLDPLTGQPVKRNNGDPQMYGGIFDSVMEKDKKLHIFDHKTASKVDNMYWAKLKTDPQISRYMLLAYQRDVPIESFIYDVILKPTISPKDLTKKGIAEIEGGSYCGIPLKEPYNGEDRETPRLYGIRVLREYLDDPGRFFQRRPVFRDNDTLLAYLESMSRTVQDMLATDRNELPVIRNYNSCTAFNSLCDYHSLCTGENPEMAGFQVREDKGDNKLSSGCSSHSREHVFLSCRQKYDFRYRQKLEPVTPDYSSNLSMGSLLHQCLEHILLDPSRKSEVEINL